MRDQIGFGNFCVEGSVPVIIFRLGGVCTFFIDDDPQYNTSLIATGSVPQFIFANKQERLVFSLWPGAALKRFTSDANYAEHYIPKLREIWFRKIPGPGAVVLMWISDSVNTMPDSAGLPKPWVWMAIKTT